MSGQRKGRDHFKVGDEAALSLNKRTGHVKLNGARCWIVRARRWGVWTCHDPADPARGTEKQPGWRYEVFGVGGMLNVEEHHLRPIRDPDVALSTWAKFVKATGIDPREPVKAKAIREMGGSHA